MPQFKVGQRVRVNYWPNSKGANPDIFIGTVVAYHGERSGRFSNCEIYGIDRDDGRMGSGSLGGAWYTELGEAGTTIELLTVELAVWV